MDKVQKPCNTRCNIPCQNLLERKKSVKIMFHVKVWHYMRNNSVRTTIRYWWMDPGWALATSVYLIMMSIILTTWHWKMGMEAMIAWFQYYFVISGWEEGNKNKRLTGQPPLGPGLNTRHPKYKKECHVLDCRVCQYYCAH